MAFTLTSPAFADGSEIPSRLTCEGDDRSPELSWSGVPEGTQSLVLIVDDPDAPEGVAPGNLPVGTGEGVNSWGRTGYGGPCPPIGRHRYFHILYALDVRLDDLGDPHKNELLAAMEGHVLARTELVGTYQKKG
jgi:hypothetical protein